MEVPRVAILKAQPRSIALFIITPWVSRGWLIRYEPKAQERKDPMTTTSGAPATPSPIAGIPDDRLDPDQRVIRIAELRTEIGDRTRERDSAIAERNTARTDLAKAKTNFVFAIVGAVLATLLGLGLGYMLGGNKGGSQPSQQPPVAASPTQGQLDAAVKRAEAAEAEVTKTKGELAACNARQQQQPAQVPTPSTPAVHVDNSCQVTIGGAQQPTKVAKPKAPAPAVSAPKTPPQTASGGNWGHIPVGATPANPQTCFTSLALSGQKPDSCKEVKVVPANQGEDEQAWTKRMAASYGIAVGQSQGGKAITGVTVNKENPK